MNNEILIKPREVARILGLTYQTLFEWRKKKKFLRYVKAGNRIYYYKDDIDNFIKNHTVLPEE